MKRAIFFKGIYQKSKEDYRKVLSFTLIFWLMFGTFISTLNIVIAAGPHNTWGTANEGVFPPGLVVPDGNEISAWIDGVCYGTATTTSGMFDLFIDTDFWGIPNVDVVKDGGYVGDTILYFLNYNPMDYYLNVSHTSSSHQPTIYEHVDIMFFNRTDLAPTFTTLRMLKINEIVLDPGDGMPQYIVIYDPGQHLGMNNITDYYLQKDNNAIHTTDGETFDFLPHTSDIIDMSNGYFYINLTSDLELNDTDELKLVWKSPYTPNNDPALTGPGNGTDIIIDRVEWGNYTNYINPITPPDDRDYDNTTLLDFIDTSSLYGSGASMIRTDDKLSPGYSGNGTDSDDCFVDFKVLGKCTPRPLPLSYPVHNMNTDEYFDTIQTAIDDNDTQDGHTIEVADGIYTENVVINKTINLTGVDRVNTIIDGGGSGDVVRIETDWVNISGFTISNGSYGIIIQGSIGNSIVNNNYIADNIVLSNNQAGIILFNDTENEIKNNHIQNNKRGIIIDQGSSYNNITNNYLNENIDGGILFSWANWNTLTNNTIISNNGYGVQMINSDNNKIFHNSFINNTIQASDDNTNNGNQWDNGYPSGGNFWSDYTGVDLNSTPTQNVPPPDGIGDTNYSIDSDSVDNYPLISPVGNLIYLYNGWNLISIPFIQSDSNIDSALYSINSFYDAAQWYNISDTSDPWKHNQITKPSHLNDLSDIDLTMSFWIHITEPNGVLFEYTGTQPTSNKSIALHPGWNMVGYPSLTNRNRTSALNNITFGSEVDAIWTFNAANKKWEDMSAGDYFEIGMGYWIHATTDCEWEVPL